MTIHKITRWALEGVLAGGHNIDPKLIEEALLKHPAVAVAAAAGSLDAHAGEVPVAYVQTKPGALGSRAAALAMYSCWSRLGSGSSRGESFRGPTKVS